MTAAHRRSFLANLVRQLVCSGHRFPSSRSQVLRRTRTGTAEPSQLIRTRVYATLTELDTLKIECTSARQYIFAPSGGRERCPAQVSAAPHEYVIPYLLTTLLHRLVRIELTHIELCHAVGSGHETNPNTSSYPVRADDSTAE